MYRNLIHVFDNAFKMYSDKIALKWKDGNDHQEMSFEELEATVDAIGVSLVEMNISKGDHVGLIADVSKEWTITAIAIQMCGLVDVPRGTDSTGKELANILKHSEAKNCFVASYKEIEKIEEELNKIHGKIKQYIVLDNDLPNNAKIKKVIKLSDMISNGKKLIEKERKEVKKLYERRREINPQDISCIIYTSGTTGDPKGVQLTHANFASQLNKLEKHIEDFGPGDKALTLLPSWHVFGRIMELLFLCKGISITYTNPKNIRDDMLTVKPTIFPAVPRIWEGIYNKLITKVKKDGKESIFNIFKSVAVNHWKAQTRLAGKERLYTRRFFLFEIVLKLYSLVLYILLYPLKLLGNILVFKKVKAATGGELRLSISGGGALPLHIDEFFTSIGISIAEGYGLTETSPVISVRELKDLLPGTVGPPLEEVEIKIVDTNGKDVTNIPGSKGTLHIRGPQVMKGYYKSPERTKEVLTEDHWFNTGDLVMLTTKGYLSIVGRSKDTIVLLGGENVEPSPIEEKLKESKYIDHVMCIGQDKKNIGALIVPNEEEIVSFSNANNMKENSVDALLKYPEINDLYKKEIQRLISESNGFKPFERVRHFAIISKSFEKGDELNNTLKILRHVVSAKYKDLIEKMYN